MVCCGVRPGAVDGWEFVQQNGPDPVVTPLTDTVFEFGTDPYRKSGAEGRIRTTDTGIFSAVLYQAELPRLEGFNDRRRRQTCQFSRSRRQGNRISRG